MQPLDLDPQFGAQLGVEIGQRLVEQIDADVAHQRAADRDALALAAGQFGRPRSSSSVILQHLPRRCRHAGRSRLRGMPATFRPNDMFPRTVMRG